MKLDYLQHQAGIRAKDIARVIGLDRPTCSKIYTRKILPNVSGMRLIRSYFGASFQELHDEDELEYMREVTDGLKNDAGAKRRDGHKLRRRISCRLTDAEFEQLHSRMSANGFESINDLLLHLAREYIKSASTVGAVKGAMGKLT